MIKHTGKYKSGLPTSVHDHEPPAKGHGQNGGGPHGYGTHEPHESVPPTTAPAIVHPGVHGTTPIGKPGY